MKQIFSLFLILFSIVASAQTQDSLVGDWHFKDLYKSTDLDSAQKGNMQTIFSELRINLKKDNTYTADLISREEGTWYYDPELRAITLMSEKGEDKVNIIEITSSTLTLELNRGKKIIFYKKLI